jgi:hypothetical protein
MPESGKVGQAIECLADIRKRGGTSSGIVVFDSEQRGGGNEQNSGLSREFAKDWRAEHPQVGTIQRRSSNPATHSTIPEAVRKPKLSP